MRTQRAAFILARMIEATLHDIQQGRVERCSPFLHVCPNAPVTLDRIVAQHAQNGGMREPGSLVDRRSNDIVGGRFLSALEKSVQTELNHYFGRPAARRPSIYGLSMPPQH